MSYLEYSVRRVPSGPAKILHLNWALIVLILAVCGFGVVMLWSVAGGRFDVWADAQLTRIGAGFVVMIAFAMVPIWFWRNVAGLAYGVALVLLVAVEVAGAIGMGAQRWIDLGVIRLQPSELMKVALVMLLAAYYDWLSPARVSRPFWVALPIVLILLPTALVLGQPDLGTALLILAGGVAVMLAAGVHLAYFGVALAGGAGAVSAVFLSGGTGWQLLKDYQYRRIDTFLDPASDPLGAGYHISQAQIALGSGGWGGRGLMQGTQNRLNFLPEKHTDFIFTTLAEEFGFVGAVSLLVLYALIVAVCLRIAMASLDRFSALVVIGIAVTFFLYFAVNMAMVMGLAPVVGVPLPLVSYGGSAMLVLMAAFGIVQSAHVHRPRQKARP